MAIDRSEFIEKIDPGLKANKIFRRFYLRFKTDSGKQHHKIFDYSNMNWDKRTRIAKARVDSLEYKNDIKHVSVGSYAGFDGNSTLNQVKDEYFIKACSATKWTEERKDSYRLYLEKSLGSKKIKDIKLNHINTVRSEMEKKGHSKQTKNGCSPRTIKKALIQTLKPILEYAYQNQVIPMVPKIELSSAHKKLNKSKKKKVDDGTATLTILYNTIMEHYIDHAFYRALFLIAMHGRRWKEIRTLEWEDIDFDKNTYTILEDRNKIDEYQTYMMLNDISDALLGIQDDRKGLVFKSPVTGRELTTPKRQLAKIRIKTSINQLDMHYFRNILVSAMGEEGIANTVLSASLGHTNLKTVYQYYLTANHTKASVVTNKTIKMITHEEKEE